MKLVHVFIAVLAITFISCKKDDVNVEVKFKLKYGDEALVMLDEYTYPDGKKLLFNRFSFYISDVSLEGGEESVIQDDVKMLNFTNVNSSKAGAEQGLTYQLKNVPQDSYSSFSFCVGVPQAKNIMKPSDFGIGDDLSIAAEYWQPWRSYIFARTEGFIDLEGDNTKEKGFALHTGGSNALVCLDANQSFNITESGNDILVEIDLKKLFGESTIYNIAANPQIHSLAQEPQVLELAGNMSKCFTLVQ